MKQKKAVVMTLIFFLSGITCIFSAGAGITSLNFLKISQGARQVGMGEAFTGIADDVNAIFWNPSGLGQLKRQQFCLMDSIWMIDVNLQYLAYALPIQGFGTIGVYGTFVNAGEIPIILDNGGNPVTTGEKAKASDLNITAAYGKKLSDIVGNNSLFSDMYAGLSVNISNEMVYNDNGGGFSANIGALYYPRYENYSLGLMVENAGVSNNRPSLPLAVKFGLGYRFSFDSMLTPFSGESYFNFPENDAAAAMDVIYYPQEAIARVNFGGEKYWQLNKYHSVALRLGYKFGVDLGIWSGFTIGAGYRLNLNKDLGFDVDYAYNPYGDLGDSHRISITGKFGGPAESHIFVDNAAALRYYKEGYALLYANRYAEAILKFSECLKRNRNYAQAYMGMGACLIRINKKEAARKAYLIALEKDPGNTKLKEFINSYRWGVQPRAPEKDQRQAPQSIRAPQ
jgi:tetratricopeptide (TPR) repeat protein